MKYQAKWGDRAGDCVEVQHPEDKRFRLVGQIERLWTRKADGLDPSQGNVVLVRPFEGVELGYKSSSIVSKVEESDWKKLVKQIQAKLPNSLKVYHQFSDEFGHVQRTEIGADAPFLLDFERILDQNCRNFQISVDVLDSESGDFFVDNDRDRSRVLKASSLIVQLELFDGKGEAIRDPKSKRPWTDMLKPFVPSESRQFNTRDVGTKQLTPLCSMLSQQLAKNSRTFRLDVSLRLNSDDENPQHPFRADLLKKIKAVNCQRVLEILPGEFPLNISFFFYAVRFRFFFFLRFRPHCFKRSDQNASFHCYLRNVSIKRDCWISDGCVMHFRKACYTRRYRRRRKCSQDLVRT